MRRALLGLASALLVSLASASGLELHFVDVGQGDALVIVAPDGQTVLYDGGPSAEPLLHYLETLGVRKIDLVVASHAHADHIGGLAEVVARYEPTYFMDNGVPHTTRTYERLLAAVAGAGSELLEPTARTLRMGDLTLSVLPPPGDPALGQNDNSVGLLVAYGDFRAAFTGDAEATQFGWWAERHPDLMTEVDVYKSSHHGSENGDTPLSVDRFRPKVVVIGVGAGNAYGHPSGWARRLYGAVGAEVMRTDLHGDVVARVEDDGSFVMRVERAGPPDETRPTRVAAENTENTANAADAADGGTGDVIVECIFFDPEGPEDGREVVTLRAVRAADVAGWWLVDAADHRFDLPARRLEEGATLDVRNPGRPVWNNGGDTATLLNAAGRVVDVFEYDGSGSTACR